MIVIHSIYIMLTQRNYSEKTRELLPLLRDWNVLSAKPGFFDRCPRDSPSLSQRFIHHSTVSDTLGHRHALELPYVRPFPQ